MNNKILLTGDLHCDGGIYTDICLAYLDHIEKFCLTNNITYVFILGDLINKSLKVKVQSFVDLTEKLHSMSKKGLKLILLKGNHDIINDEGKSLIEVYKPFAHIVDSVANISIYGTDFTLLPYMKDISSLSSVKKTDFLLTHLPINGFSFGNEHISTDSFDPMLFDDYKYVFSGHFHLHQETKNIVYIGSPYQIDKGEAGQKKGFIVFDCDFEIFDYIEYNKAPKYVVIKPEEYEMTDVKNNFVYVEMDQKVENMMKFRHLLYDRGAIEVIPIFKKETDYEILENQEVEYNGNTYEMLIEYVNKLSYENNIVSQDIISVLEKAHVEMT